MRYTTSKWPSPFCKQRKEKKLLKEANDQTQAEEGRRSKRTLLLGSLELKRLSLAELNRGKIVVVELLANLLRGPER